MEKYSKYLALRMIAAQEDKHFLSLLIRLIKFILSTLFDHNYIHLFI